MAGSISLSLTQQFDLSGNLLAGGQVFFVQAGTVATPQNAYQDLGLTLPWPNPYTLLTNGRIPQVYFADGYIKVRIVDHDGVQVFNQDNIPVTGPSTSGGGGGGVDPTTIIQTGWLVPIYGTGVVSGFVRANARTIGSATSGATERANADTSALFAFLWNADANLVVSSGRGASAAADYSANKTIALPDFRGRAIAGLDDMGNAAAGRLTATYFGTAATVLGAAGGGESVTLAANQIPSLTSVNASQAISVTSTGGNVFQGGTPAAAATGGAGNTSTGGINAAVSSSGNNSISVAYTNASQASTRTASPAMLATIYLKL